MPKALCKENLCFVLFFTICFSNFRQKDYSKAIIGREILLFRLWGFDGIKPYVIIYKTNHGPALQSLGVKGVYEFPEMFNVPKTIRPKMFFMIVTLGYTLWKKSINHSEAIVLNRCLTHLSLKSLDRILKQNTHPSNFVCLPKFVSEEAKAKTKRKMKQTKKSTIKNNCPREGKMNFECHYTIFEFLLLF